MTVTLNGEDVDTSGLFMGRFARPDLAPVPVHDLLIEAAIEEALDAAA